MTPPTVPSPTAARLTGGFVHVHGDAHGLPPLDPEVPCCETSAYGDDTACSCWDPIYTPDPTVDVQHGPMAVRRGLCHDCAYRPGSPERAEQDDEQLPALADYPFTCHQGMPVLRGYTRPELDARGLDGGFCLWAPAWGDRDDFGPIQFGDRSWRADGQPAERCAGWAGVAGLTTRPARARPATGEVT